MVTEILSSIEKKYKIPRDVSKIPPVIRLRKYNRHLVNELSGLESCFHSTEKQAIQAKRKRDSKHLPSTDLLGVIIVWVLGLDSPQSYTLC